MLSRLFLFGRSPSTDAGSNVDSNIKQDTVPPIPEDTLGLRILGTAPTKADVDIVSVHGLGGDAFRTWTASNGKLWLRDFLPGQLLDPPDEFKKGPDDTKVARIMTFGYNANIFDRDARENTFRAARDLLGDLTSRRKGNAHTRPVIFIGHSLGGIVIKKALAFARLRHELYGELLASVEHICFLGTPHQGTNPSSMTGIIRSLAQVLTGAEQGSPVGELQLWSDAALQANANFAEIANELTITSFFETKPYKRVLVVDEGSATLNAKRESVVSLIEDHVTMCKFGNETDASYRRIFLHLHAVVSAIGSTEQQEEKQRRIKCLFASVPPSLSKRMSPVDQEWLKILDWISHIPYGEHHNAITDARTPDTCEWLLLDERFQKWKNTDSSTTLWLQGSPGVGKTFLTSKIIDHIRGSIEPSSSNGFAFFYCDQNEEERRKPLTVLQSYVRQLTAPLGYTQEIRRKICDAYDEKKRGASNFSLKDCLEYLLELVNNYTKTTLVLDALDECHLESRRKLIESIEILLSKSKRLLHVFISSRPNVDIREKFDSGLNIEIEAIHNEKDIQLFINEEIIKRRAWRGMYSELKGEVIQTLLFRSQGMFQWVFLQIRQILELGTETAIRDRLGKLPSGLEDTYNEIYRKIERSHPSDRSPADRALMWVLCACRPLDSRELLYAIRLDPESDDLNPSDFITERQLLHLCNNLLVLDSRLDVWRFSHLSVAEYLETKPHLCLLESHCTVAKICLRLLTDGSDDRDNLRNYFKDRRNDAGEVKDDADGEDDCTEDEYDISSEGDISYKSDSVYDEQEDESHHVVDDEEPQYSLKIYSMYHWVTHIQTQEGRRVDTLLSKLLRRFLGSPGRSSSHYRRWYYHVKMSCPPGLFSDIRGDIGELNFCHICPGVTTILAVCRLSMNSLLADWWPEVDIPLLQRSLFNEYPLGLTDAAGSKSIYEIPLKRRMPMSMDANDFLTILHAAAGKRDNIETIKFLVQESVYWDPSSRYSAYSAAILQAARKGNTEILDFLVQELASIDNTTRVRYIFQPITQNQVDVIKPLIHKSKVDVNAFPISDRRLFFHMTEPEIAKFSVQDGETELKLYIPTKNIGEALTLAANRGKVETIRVLLEEYKVDVNMHIAGCFGSALISAISGGNVETVRFLVKECKADVNLRLENGSHGSALITAAVCGNAEVVKFLIQEGGANIDFCPEFGDYGSALAAAAFFGHMDCVEALLSLGADVNLRLQLGRYNTALQASRAKGGWPSLKRNRKKVAELLIRHGAIDCPEHGKMEGRVEEIN